MTNTDSGYFLLDDLGDLDDLAVKGRGGWVAWADRTIEGTLFCVAGRGAALDLDADVGAVRLLRQAVVHAAVRDAVDSSLDLRRVDFRTESLLDLLDALRFLLGGDGRTTGLEARTGRQPRLQSDKRSRWSARADGAQSGAMPTSAPSAAPQAVRLVGAPGATRPAAGAPTRRTPPSSGSAAGTCCTAPSRPRATTSPKGGRSASPRATTSSRGGRSPSCRRSGSTTAAVRQRPARW